MSKEGTRVLIFWVQAGGKAGWGHLIRSSALAQAAREEGFLTHCALFLNGEATVVPLEAQHAFNGCQLLPADGARLTQFLELLQGRQDSCRAVIIDDHEATDDDLRAIRRQLDQTGGLLAVIDDEAGRRLEMAHLVVNPGITAKAEDYPHAVEVLAGQELALLRTAFRKGMEKATPHAEGTRIALTFGGTDVLALVPQALDWLADMDTEGFFPGPLEVTVLGSRNAATEGLILQKIKAFGKGEWIRAAGVAQMAETFLRAGIGITACGGTTYEMAACRLPFVGIIVADNQAEQAAAGQQRWGMPILDARKGLLRSDFRKAVMAVQRLAGGRRRDYSGVDGLGAQRVIGRLSKLAGESSVRIPGR